MIDGNYVTVLRVGLHALNAKLIAILALLMTFGLAVYAMIEPSLFRIIVVTYFGTVICLPALIMSRVRAPRAAPEAQNDAQ